MLPAYFRIRIEAPGYAFPIRRQTVKGRAVFTRLDTFARLLYEKLLRYVLKFGIVGLAGYVVDVGLFNLLRVGVFGDDHFFQGPIGAKIISAGVATIATWFGNRYWTFREHRRKNYLLELAEFSTVSVGGILIGLACLWVSHYLLGFTSLLADNISSNVVGLVLGTSFRFLLYRFWVYGHHRADGLTTRASSDGQRPAQVSTSHRPNGSEHAKVTRGG
nr:GtrA family protein [Frigoribacterium sp. CG_9.8]